MIAVENLAAFAVFSAVAAGTPGPNNMMTLAVAARVGFRRTLPLVAGIACGVGSLIALVGFGLGALFAAFPVLYDILRFAGSAFLLFLAWRIAGGGSGGETQGEGRSVGFIDGAVFQLVNPKAWVIAVSSVSTYAPQEGFHTSVLLLAAVFAITAFAAVSLWAVFGTGLRRVMSHARHGRWVHRALGLGLALSVLPILLADL